MGAKEVETRAHAHMHTHMGKHRRVGGNGAAPIVRVCVHAHACMAHAYMNWGPSSKRPRSSCGDLGEGEGWDEVK